MSMTDFDLIRAGQALASMPRPTEAERQTSRTRHASALARFTARRRLELDLSVATAAALSGLELSEWYALEAGWVPDDDSTLRAIADTLEVHWSEYQLLAFWSRCAQSPGR